MPCLVYSQFVFVLQVDSTMEQDKVYKLLGVNWSSLWWNVINYVAVSHLKNGGKVKKKSLRGKLRNSS